ncbi:hypothetical protein M404DRAFT_1002660, partial [Pisolithus tinctorius Marx 270]
RTRNTNGIETPVLGTMHRRRATALNLPRRKGFGYLKAPYTGIVFLFALDLYQKKRNRSLSAANIRQCSISTTLSPSVAVPPRN